MQGSRPRQTLCQMQTLKGIGLIAMAIVLLLACKSPACAVTGESMAKEITAFSLGSAAGLISGTAISVTVNAGTDLTELVATFTTTAASVKVGSTVQVSGTTVNDFTDPVTYTACAEDGSSQAYTVTVSLSPALVLPDTGQTASYTDTAGEDGDRSVNPPSYTDNGDGTVTDDNTGLMWEQYDGGEMTYEDAVSRCAVLALGGYRDWRLPTAHELYSINYLDALGPALETAGFPDDFETVSLAAGFADIATPSEQTAASQYVRELYWWSSDSRADTSERAWVTNAGGGIGAHQKSETKSAGVASKDGKIRFIHVRAVRNATASPCLASVRFADNGDGTVTDRWTGLVWQQTVSSSTYTWEGALAFANALNASGGYAGHSDWRLPNVRELFSLVDVAKMKPCIDGSAFELDVLAPYAEPSTPDDPGALWSSTSMYNADPSASFQAWDLHDLYSGIISYSAKTASEHILLVRGGD